MVTASYYPETDFDFPISESTIVANVIDEFGFVGTSRSTSTFNATAEREEWDAALGVYVLYPYLVILGGYKEIDQKLSLTGTQNSTISDGAGNTVAEVSSPLSPLSSKFEISGPTIGISGSVPMAHGFGIYASYAHGFLDSEITETFSNFAFATRTFDADYDVAELGFTYNTKEWLPHMPLSAATVYAGYRYQNIETDLKELSATLGNRTDTTRGFVAGLNLSW